MRAEGRAHVTKEYWDKTKQNRKRLQRFKDETVLAVEMERNGWTGDRNLWGN